MPSNWTGSLNNVATAFANVSEFRTFLGVATVNDALAKIYRQYKTDPDHPHLVIIQQPGVRYTARDKPAYTCPVGQSAQLLFGKVVTEVSTEADFTTMTDLVGYSIEGFLGLYAPTVTGNSLELPTNPEFTLLVPPRRSSKGEQIAEGIPGTNNVMYTLWSLTWG